MFCHLFTESCKTVNSGFIELYTKGNLRCRHMGHLP